MKRKIGALIIAITIVVASVVSCAPAAPTPGPAAPTPTAPAAAIGPSETALIIIDMQKDVGPEGPMAEAPFVKWCIEHNVVDHIADALEIARENDVFIVHIVVTFREGYPEAAQGGFWAAIPGTGGFIEGTKGAEIIDELKPELGPREIIISKIRTSSFYATPLQEILTQQGIKKVIISGEVVDSCVNHTVMDAVDYGYSPIAVLSDCVVAASDASYHVFCDESWPFHMVDVITLSELEDYIKE